MSDKPEALPSRALIPQFMEFAYLRLFFWIEFTSVYHESLGTFPEDALEKVAKTKQLCKYRTNVLNGGRT